MFRPYTPNPTPLPRGSHDENSLTLAYASSYPKRAYRVPHGFSDLRFRVFGVRALGFSVVWGLGYSRILNVGSMVLGLSVGIKCRKFKFRVSGLKIRCFPATVCGCEFVSGAELLLSS